MRDLLLRLLRDEGGTTAIEYGLIAALVALIIVGSIAITGTSIQSMFNFTAGRATSVWDHAAQ